MNLRDYQLNAVSDVLASYFDGAKKTLLVMPTASGKTVVASSIASNFNKVIWAAHREELLTQASKHGNYTLKSVFDKSIDQCDLLIIDECHHIPAETISSFVSNIKFNRMLGITATPERLDRMGLAFDATIYGTSIEDLIRSGYLTPIDLYTIRTQFDSDVTISEMMYNSKLDSTILFVRNKEHGAFYKNILSSYYRVEEVYGDSDRKTILTSFADGKIDVVISCMILTEGTDLPITKNIVLARSTDSAALAKQMIGRGLRKHELKEVCNVFECIDMRSKSKSVSSLVPIRNHYSMSKHGKEWCKEIIKSQYDGVFDGNIQM